jgi:putative transposase|tara:strand:+ start:255 stop:521 length:267 start_codon:yes stop_codon:yes gene_type:complete
MKSKRYTTEQIIKVLRAADNGKSVAETCREHNVSAQSFYKWRRKFGNMELADAKKLKHVEQENLKLKEMLAEAMLENRALKAVTSKNW